MNRRWKHRVFEWLGLDPEGVVVSFLSGDPDRAAGMARTMVELVPERRHFFVTLRGQVPNGLPAGEVVEIAQERAWLDVVRAFRGYRVALAAVLFDGAVGGTLRCAALCFAPGRILAFNRTLERHHLRFSTVIASVLFLKGVPLDRIFLRPIWLVPWKKDRSVIPQQWRRSSGRAPRSGYPQVAVLTPYFPWPLSHGGAVRIYNLLLHASEHYDISLFAFEDGQTEADFDRLREFCTELAIAAQPRYREPRWASLLPPEVCEYRSKALRASMGPLPILQTEYTQLAWYGGDILVEHDVTFDLFRQIHSRDLSLSSWWNLWRWERFENRALRKARQVVVMSEKDKDQVGVPCCVIPNGVDLARFEPQQEQPGRRLLFIGSFRHFPNLLAYRWFVAEVWPLLSQDIELTVVAGPNPELYCNEPPPDARVRRLGFVADVRPLYTQANLVVIPTLVSAGTNLKALEAMAMARAIVSTSSGIAGLGLAHRESVWIADGAKAFAQGILALLAAPEQRDEMARRARAVAVDKFGWDALAERQVDLWNSLRS